MKPNPKALSQILEAVFIAESIMKQGRSAASLVQLQRRLTGEFDATILAIPSQDDGGHVFEVKHVQTMSFCCSCNCGIKQQACWHFVMALYALALQAGLHEDFLVFRRRLFNFFGRNFGTDEGCSFAGSRPFWSRLEHDKQISFCTR
jgi:hypothetical protein